MKYASMVLGAMMAGASLLPAQNQTVSPPTVTVTGSANKATIAFTSVKGTVGYAVMRRIMFRETDGRILATQAWGMVANVAGSPFTDVLPKPSTIYEYRVDAALRSDSVLSSAAVQYTAPAYTTPTNVVITGSGLQVNLSWTPAAAVTGYLVIRYQLRSDGSETRVQSTPAPISGSTFTDAIPVGGAIYNYEIVSVDPIGSQVSSGRVKYAAPVVGPAVTIVGTGNQASLSWAATTGAYFYDVMRETLDASGQVIAKATFAAQNLQAPGFTDQLSGPGVRLRYTVVVRGYDGNPIVNSTPVTFTAADYMTPVGLIAAGGGGKVSLSWRPAQGVVAYQVQRRTVRPDGSWVDVSMRNKLLNATDFVDDIPTPGLVYEYQIVGVGPDGRLYPAPWVRYTAGSW